MERIEIANPFPGASSYFAGTTTSTQEDAKRIAATGWSPGSLVVAEEQTAGRGRFPEREWESERGKNLLVTIFLGPPQKALPIRVGLALCGAISDYASSIGADFAFPPALKWPNDLMLGDKKVAGILCEAARAGPATGAVGVFAGIGLNCNQLRFPSALAGKATSLALELGREVEPLAILERILGRLALDLGPGASTEAEGSWRRAANEILWRRGGTVCFQPGLAARSNGGERIVGTLEGVDEEGSVLIRAQGEGEARAYAAGELRIAPPTGELTGGPSRP
jgi:BirA family transcriptional regulator, biotin operon repressor / biotin---[acetyl-CoA-carboxylase] ligase